MKNKRIFVFVVMPFSEKFQNVYDFAIKQACSEEKVYCERLDEQIFQESMLNQIYTQIFKSDFVIADMSERNANVFYEVGYAHAMEKNVILITNNSDDIPFDLKHHQHIVYNPSKLNELKDKLKERINFYSNQENDENTDFNEYEISINGEKLVDNMSLEIDPNMDDESSLLFNIDFHNPTARKIVPDDSNLCLIIPKEWLNREYNSYPLMNKDLVIMDIGSIPNLLPYAYSSNSISIDKNPKNPEIFYHEFTGIILRIISRHGNYDKKLNVRFKKNA